MATFDSLIDSIREGGFEALIASLDPSAIQLMNRAADMFEEYRELDQMMVLAIMWGMLCGSIEGEPNQWEKDNKAFITYPDRERLFVALAKITFDAAMEKRKDPNCPQPRRM